MGAQGDSGRVGHSRETLGLGTLGWALQGVSGVGHSRVSLRLEFKI